jgi:single-strand DNA-binding protein
MNKVILMGRLTRDPEVRYSNNANGEQMAIARYTLAVDRRGKVNEGQQNADFIRCVAFGRSGEFTEKYFHQGTKVVVEGRIQTGSYQDKDGKTVYTTDVVVENQEFAESKAAGQQAQPQSQSQPQNPTNPQPVGDGFMNIPESVDDSGLPFNF